MSFGVYQFNPSDYHVTKEMQSDYDDNGYIVYKNLLDLEELDNILKVLESPNFVSSHGYGVPDGLGTNAKFVIWSHPGNDVTGMLARSEKVVNTIEKANKKEYGGDTVNVGVESTIEVKRDGKEINVVISFTGEGVSKRSRTRKRRRTLPALDSSDEEESHVVREDVTETEYGEVTKDIQLCLQL